MVTRNRVQQLQKRGVIMTTAERLYQVTKQLPEPMLAELLDFAEY